MSHNELNLALLDVRKACRLLADYQQRVIELLDFIKNELNAEHYYHYMDRYDSRSVYKIYTDQEAGLKLLPMRDMNLLWHRTRNIPDGEYWQNNISKDDLVFDVNIVSDEDSTLSVEESNSELHIYIYSCIKYKRNKNWYEDLWLKFDYPEFNQVSIFEDEKLGIKYQVYGEKLNLADLYDKESVKNILHGLKDRASKALNQKI
ncbi:hypothetical protein ACFGW2_01010 [Pasteurella multocida]